MSNPRVLLETSFNGFPSFYHIEHRDASLKKDLVPSYASAVCTSTLQLGIGVVQ